MCFQNSVFSSWLFRTPREKKKKIRKTNWVLNLNFYTWRLRASVDHHVEHFGMENDQEFFSKWWSSEDVFIMHASLDLTGPYGTKFKFKGVCDIESASQWDRAVWKCSLQNGVLIYVFAICNNFLCRFPNLFSIFIIFIFLFCIIPFLNIPTNYVPLPPTHVFIFFTVPRLNAAPVC